MDVKTPVFGGSVYGRVRRLYLEAFPAEERRPLWLLWLLDRRREDNRLLAYYHGVTFVGFTATVETERYRYISFIAVDPRLRDKGYGAELLKVLGEQEPQRELLVEVESPAGEERGDLRLRRKNFYLRNGFCDTGHHIQNRGVDYDILSTGTEFNPADYWAIFERMSLGVKAGLRRWLRRDPKE